MQCHCQCASIRLKSVVSKWVFWWLAFKHTPQIPTTTWPRFKVTIKTFLVDNDCFHTYHVISRQVLRMFAFRITIIILEQAVYLNRVTTVWIFLIELWTARTITKRIFIYLTAIVCMSKTSRMHWPERSTKKRTLQNALRQSLANLSNLFARGRT